MKLRLATVKHIIRETQAADRYMGEEEARTFILDMDGDETSDGDIIDEETGEIYLKQGDSFNESPWNPDHKVNTRRAKRDEVYAERAGVWDEYYADLDDDGIDGNDYFSRQREQEIETREKARRDYNAALKEFISSFKNFADEAPDMEPHEVAHDMAANFFQEYPEWETWVRVLNFNPDYFHDMITDHVYDAMMDSRY